MRLTSVAVALIAAAACSTPSTPDDPCAATPGTGIRTGSSADLTIWVVHPRSTDGCITQRLDSHFVFRAPAVTPVGRLFVFLPGTTAIAQYYQLIVAEAARAGYHAVGISYPNDNAVGVLCASQPATCYGDARLEILTGQATSSVVAVDRANCIENRIVKLLRFMRTTEPAGDWGQFLLGDTAVVWSKVAVAGHSQGGGHTLFIAQRYAVWRATAYSSAGDFLAGSAAVAPWVLQPYATPATRLFGFISNADELVSPVPTLAAWSAIGMAGAAVDVDVTTPPFGATQRFVTTAAPANPLVTVSPNHNVVAVDVNTPKVGGTTTPVFAGVWRALSFP